MTEQPLTPDQIIDRVYHNPNYNPGALSEVLHEWLVAKGINDIRTIGPLKRDRSLSEFWRSLKKHADLPHEKKSFPIGFKNEVREHYLARLDS